MALIKCPGCGKEISDSAKKCPQCGLDIKKYKKKGLKDAQEPLECPECGNKLDSNTRTCPHCGNPISKKRFEIKIKKLVKSKKFLEVTAVGIVLIIVFSYIMSQVLKDDYYEYTCYIGEDAEKLTDHYEIEETNDENDTYIASLSDSNMYVGNQQGKYSYIYSGRKLSEYNLDQNEIYMMIWGYDASSEEEVKNIKEALISSYGDYDDKIIYSGGNNTNFNLKYGESITNYKWEKTHKFDIYFSVFKEGDEVKATVIGWLKHDIKNMTLDDYLNFFF